MKTVSAKVTGNLFVKQNTTYNQVLAETVTVEEGITARLYGKVTKNVTLKKDALVYLHGELGGKVINHGGTLYVCRASGKVEAYEPQNASTYN